MMKYNEHNFIAETKLGKHLYHCPLSTRSLSLRTHITGFSLVKTDLEYLHVLLSRHHECKVIPLTDHTRLNSRDFPVVHRLAGSAQTGTRQTSVSFVVKGLKRLIVKLVIPANGNKIASIRQFRDVPNFLNAR